MKKIQNSKEFAEAIASETPTFVDFYADWCPPCKRMAPLVEELEKQYPNVQFLKVNVDENHELTMKYNVMSIPTFSTFKENRPIENAVGAQKVEYLKDMLYRAKEYNPFY